MKLASQLTAVELTSREADIIRFAMYNLASDINNELITKAETSATIDDLNEIVLKMFKAITRS
jgi:hypothetical protein